MRPRHSRWAEPARHGSRRTRATARWRSPRTGASSGPPPWSRCSPDRGSGPFQGNAIHQRSSHPTSRPRTGAQDRAVPAPPVRLHRGSRMKLRILAVIGLIVVGVGAIAFAVIGPSLGSTAATQYLTATATRENVVAQSVATGSVAPSSIYGLAFGSQPQLVSSTASSSSSSASGASGSSKWLVKTVSVAVGDSVTAGQTLAVADSSTVASTLAIANANLAVAKAKLATDKGGLSATDRAAAALSIQQAQQSLGQAQKSAPISTASTNLQLSQAEAALRTAQNQLAADTAAGPLATTITADQNAVTNAQNNLDALNLTIAAAQAQASSTSTQNSLALQQAQQAVTDAQQAPQSLQATLTSAQAKLAADNSANLATPGIVPQTTINTDLAAVNAAQTAISNTVASQVAAAQAKLATLNAQLSG